MKRLTIGHINAINKGNTNIRALRFNWKHRKKHLVRKNWILCIYLFIFNWI